MAFLVARVSDVAIKSALAGRAHLTHAFVGGVANLVTAWAFVDLSVAVVVDAVANLGRSRIDVWIVVVAIRASEWAGAIAVAVTVQICACACALRCANSVAA